jgi:hypothetical protein
VRVAVYSSTQVRHRHVDDDRFHFYASGKVVGFDTGDEVVKVEVTSLF